MLNVLLFAILWILYYCFIIPIYMCYFRPFLRCIYICIFYLFYPKVYPIYLALNLSIFVSASPTDQFFIFYWVGSIAYTQHLERVSCSRKKLCYLCYLYYDIYIYKYVIAEREDACFRFFY